MVSQDINQIISNQNSVKEVVNVLKKDTKSPIQLIVMVGSSKSSCLSSCITTRVHMVAMNNKDEDQCMCNYMY